MAGPQVTSVFTARETMSRTLNSIESSTRRLDRAFGSLRGRMRSAIEFNLVSRGMDLLWRGIHRVTNAIPDLVRRGEQWAGTIDSITDATGMAARQASELAAVNQRVGGTNDALVRGLQAMAKSVYTQRDAWKEMGVQVALNRDGSVDAYRTFQNLRGAISATGGSLLSTAAAQKVLSRSGRELLDLLQLTPRQYRMLARDAQRSGQIMSDAAVRAGEAWQRAQQRFGATLDGLGTRILSGLAPVLTRFVDGFTTFVQNNMDNLVRLVVGGANTILTVVGDLLGIDLGSWSFTEQVENLGTSAPKAAGGLKDISKATKDATTATKAHSSAMRDQLDLQKELRRAQADLARERSRSALFSRMSGVDAELWRQQKAARIKDAQDRVAQARKALTEHRQTLGQMEQQAASSGARIRGALRLDKPSKGGGGGQSGGIFGDIGGILTESTKTGHQIAETLKDAIFGDDRSLLSPNGKVIEVRSGGLIGALQGVQKWLQDVSGWLSGLSGHLTNLNGLLGGNGPLVLGIAALAKLMPGIPGLPVGKVVQTGGSLLSTVGGALGGAAILNAILRDPGPQKPDEYSGEHGLPMLGMTGDDIAKTHALMARMDREREAGGVVGFWSKFAKYRATSLFQFPGHRPLTLTGAGSGAGGGNPFGDMPGGAGGHYVGFGVNPASGVGLGQYGPFGAIFRRYLGPTSPLVTGQDDQTSSLGGIYGATESTAGNTTPLGDGTVGVQNPAFPDIGVIKDIKVPKVPVDASGKTLTVWTPGGKKLPTEGTGKGGRVTVDWGSTGGQVRKTATWTETTARRLQYGDYSAGRLLFDIRTAVNKMAGTGPGSSSTRP